MPSSGSAGALPLRLAERASEVGLPHEPPGRTRVQQAVQFRPATAKQLAVALRSTPGAIGHHLHVLEEAGLVQVVARRLINNLTVATYYTRTAASFLLDFPAP
jgi:DNA-binding transcriptional ArsR family regulator